VQCGSPVDAECLKSTFAQIQCGWHRNWKWWNRYNSAADCAVMLKCGKHVCTGWLKKVSCWHSTTAYFLSHPVCMDVWLHYTGLYDLISKPSSTEETSGLKRRNASLIDTFFSFNILCSERYADVGVFAALRLCRVHSTTTIMYVRVLYRLRDTVRCCPKSRMFHHTNLCLTSRSQRGRRRQNFPRVFSVRKQDCWAAACSSLCCRGRIIVIVSLSSLYSRPYTTLQPVPVLRQHWARAECL